MPEFIAPYFEADFFSFVFASFAVLLASCIAIVLLIIAVIVLIEKHRIQDLATELRSISILLFGVTIVGGVAGFAGGMSRVGVVGEVIPAALTFLGGLVVYLFGVDRSKGTIASINAIAFALALFINYSAGAQIRTTTEKKRAEVSFCTSIFADHNVLASKTALIAANEMFGDRCRGLIADAPG